MGHLDGLQIMVVEDDFFIAVDLAETLAREGAEIIGPVGSLAEAMDLATRAPGPDHAVLDVNLRREKICRLAHVLGRRSVPFVFLTGYDRESLAPEFRDAPIPNKPVDIGRLVSVLTAGHEGGD